MSVKDALLKRHSVRAFLPTPISQQQISNLLDLARYAPSGANTQPWQVAVVMGETKQLLSQLIQTAFEQGEPAEPDYSYYPSQWQSPYIDRRRACGLQLYQSLSIEKADKQAQRQQWAANYRAFDAPVMLLFFMDNSMQTGSFLDFGMFLQSLMLAATEQGLATCPQAALAEYPAQVKQLLGYADDSILLCGMALGYEDNSAAVNQYRTERASVTSFTRFFS
ncbi:MAG: nitroreductase [Methylophaga sp.]|nr:nitroreductase [Methylophaga sp.]